MRSVRRTLVFWYSAVRSWLTFVCKGWKSLWFVTPTFVQVAVRNAASSTVRTCKSSGLLRRQQLSVKRALLLCFCDTNLVRKTHSGMDWWAGVVKLYSEEQLSFSHFLVWNGSALRVFCSCDSSRSRSLPVDKSSFKACCMEKCMSFLLQSLEETMRSMKKVFAVPFLPEVVIKREQMFCLSRSFSTVSSKFMCLSHDGSIAAGSRPTYLPFHASFPSSILPSHPVPSRPIPAQPFPSLPFPSLPFPSLPFPSLPFPFPSLPLHPSKCPSICPSFLPSILPSFHPSILPPFHPSILPSCLP